MSDICFVMKTALFGKLFVVCFFNVWQNSRHTSVTCLLFCCVVIVYIWALVEWNVWLWLWSVHWQSFWSFLLAVHSYAGGFFYASLSVPKFCLHWSQNFVSISPNLHRSQNFVSIGERNSETSLWLWVLIELWPTPTEVKVMAPRSLECDIGQFGGSCLLSHVLSVRWHLSGQMASFSSVTCMLLVIMLVSQFLSFINARKMALN